MNNNTNNDNNNIKTQQEAEWRGKPLSAEDLEEDDEKLGIVMYCY